MSINGTQHKTEISYKICAFVAFEPLWVIWTCQCKFIRPLTVKRNIWELKNSVIRSKFYEALLV